ncbi:tetratricopeptide repeat protein [bacterium]|nr:tetratricopeptide repeat protein [bacterium]
MKQYIIILLICLAGLGLVFFLLPQEKELALMHMKDKDYDTAKKGFEQIAKTRGLDTTTVGTLAQLYLQNGEVNKAIEVMEAYVKENPNSVDARIRLGQYYQYAQRPEDYLRNLEQLSKMDSQKTYLAELSRIYNYNASYQQQIDVLSKLADGGKEAEPQLLTLVQLLASMDQKSDALAYMKLYKSRYPQSMGRDQTQLLFSLLVDNNQVDEAVKLAQDWAAKTKDPSTLAYYAAAISTLGHTEEAIAMLKPHMDQFDQYPDLLVAYINLHRAIAHNAEAYKILGDFYRKGTLPQQLLPTYLELAVAFGDEDMVMELAEKIDVEQLNKPLVLNMVDLSFNERHQLLRTFLRKKLSNEYLARNQVIHMGLLAASGDRAGAQKVAAGINTDKMEYFERAHFAVFLARVGMNDRAVAVLRSLDVNNEAVDPLMPRVANAYILAGAQKEGLTFAENVRNKRMELNKVTTPVNVGWLLLSAANGREKEVFAFLDKEPTATSNRILLDLYYVSSAANQPHFMVAVAERYHAAYPQDEIGLTNLMQAYLRAGEAGKTIALLEGKYNSEQLAKNDIYFAALQKVVRAGPKSPGYAAAREKYIQLLIARYNDPKLDQDDREVAMNNLLEMGAYNVALPMVKQLAYKNPAKYGPLYVNYALKAKQTKDVVAFTEFALKSPSVSQNDKNGYIGLLIKHGDASKALPYLESLAVNQGGNWLFAYEDALKKRGIKKDLVPLWKARAAKTTNDAEMRVLAYKLSDAGEKTEASRLFFKLAQKAPKNQPNNKDVQQTVFLWGQQPPAEGVNWLLANANGSEGKARAGWLKHLVSVRRNDLVADVMQGRDLTRESEETVDMYITALQNQKNKAVLEPILRQAMEREKNPERVAFYANAANSAGLMKLAREGFERVLNTDAFAPYMLKELGNISFFEGDFDAAKSYYNRYLKETSDKAGEGDYIDPDYLVHLRLGIIYLRSEEHENAKKHLVRTLELIENAQEKDRNIWLAEAKARYLLGREGEALEIYKWLNSQNPDDYEVAGDYAEVLIKQQKYNEAERLINSLAPLPDGQEPVQLLGDDYEQGGSAIGSQKLRIELLRAELMVGRGQTQQALAKYKALEAEYPDSPYPKIGQASIYNYMGFQQQALRSLDDATAVAPENKDLARVRKRIYDRQRTQLTAGAEWRQTQDAEEGIMTTVKGHKLLKNYDKIGFVYDHFFYKMDNAYNLDGTVSNVDDNAWMAELYYHHIFDNGNVGELGVIGSNSGAGVEGAYSVPGFLGALRFFGEYNKPFWILGQGIVSEANRDRYGVYQDMRYGENWFGGVGTNYVRYTVDSGDDEVADGMGVNALVGYRLPQFTKPELRVVYGFDGEYLFDDSEFYNRGGARFRPLPIFSREIHSLALNVRDDISHENFWWEAYGGYAYDRLGGHGPFAGGELNYLLTDEWLATLRGSSTLSSNATGDRVDRVGAYITKRF